MIVMALIVDKLLSFSRVRVGYIILLFILIIIAVGIIKPPFYLLGWDNYSSYFSVPTNLFRTFFSSWREYRGLGVPSDSEVVDIFRQLFFYVFHFIAPEQILDQLYIVICLFIGVLGMYSFASVILGKYSHSVRVTDAGATIAALFYLFNLNTLAIYFFPIITYITRFAAIPVIFYIFMYLSQAKKVSVKTFILICIALAFTSGSYITGTVFITTVLSLGLWSIFQRNYRRIFLIFIFFFAFNSFWILPFLNYTKEKSAIIRLAPTFIDANESQLNKGKSFFDFGKQLVLYPNFFDTKYTEISNRASHMFHRLAADYVSQPTSAILYIFPLLYLLGSVSILSRAKKHRTELWIPVLLIIYLLLSMKEYSPLGFLYAFFDKNVPYFGVLFRFGDTKFHPYSAFAGSLAAGLFIVNVSQLYRSLYKKRLFVHPSVLILIFMVPTMWVFREYMTGSLIGSFMYNKLPPAYKEIARVINADTGSGRVLHLPFDKDAYWKSYAWGGIGSSFFHYMLNKPFIDKTFEPASMEHAFLHKRLTDLLKNNQVLNEDARKERIGNFSKLLADTGIGYIVLDQTVTSSIYARGISFGGTYSYPDVKVLTDGLIEEGLATRVNIYDIPILDYLGIYGGWHPLSEADHDALLAKGPFTIELIKISSETSKIGFEKQAAFIDSRYKTIIQDEELPDSPVTFQSSKTAGIIFPFRKRDGILTRDSDRVTLTFPDVLRKNTYIIADDGRSTSKLIELTGRRLSEEIIIDLAWRKFPSIGEKEFLLPLGQATFDIPQSALQLETNEFRLVINGVVVPLAGLNGNNKNLGSVVLTGDQADISLLTLADELPLNTRLLSLTEDPNCFGDRLEDYAYSVRTSNGFGVTTQEGSTCWFYPLGSIVPKDTAHTELYLDISGDSQDFDGISSFTTGKPQLVEYLLKQPKPVLMRICAFEPNIDECLNKHQYVTISEKERIHIPLDQPVAGREDVGVLFALKTIGDQYAEAIIQGGTIATFRNVDTQSVPLRDSAETGKFVNTGNTDLTVSFPIPLSRYSFSLHPGVDGFSVSNKPCDQDDSFRTFRTVDNTWISFVGNCYNQLFQTVPFDSSRFLLWTTGYTLFSGKYPKFILMDKLLTYVDEYLSLYQGYPDITGFKSLQNPESVTGYSEEKIGDILNDRKTENAYVYLPPRKELEDTRQKEFTLHQHAENEGILRVNTFDVLELPDSWRNLRLEPESGSTQNFQVPENFHAGKILPSLWKIELPLAANEASYLLNFREAFDRQWEIVFTQKPKGTLAVTDHGTCNGFSNCFILKAQGEGTATFYLLYFPEVLAILGWTMTLGAIGLFARYWVKAS